MPSIAKHDQTMTPSTSTPMIIPTTSNEFMVHSPPFSSIIRILVFVFVSWYVIVLWLVVKNLIIVELENLWYVLFKLCNELMGRTDIAIAGNPPMIYKRRYFILYLLFCCVPEL